MDGDRGGKRLRLLVAGACAVVLVGASAERAVAGGLTLDPGFGDGGRVRVPFETGQGGPWGFTQVRVAGTPDDGVVVATGRAVARFLADGQLDGGFGQNGIVTAAEPEGASFEISGLAVDSYGRVLIAGTATYPALSPPPRIPGPSESWAGWMGPPPTPQLARIVRYLPDGTLDPQFGNGGVVETDFGLPPPIGRAGESLLERPWVEATGVAVDSQGRVVVSGGASARPDSLCAHDFFGSYLEFASYVARLDQQGAPDSSFGGGDGVTEMRSARPSSPLRDELATEPRVDGSDQPVYLAQPSRFCRSQEPGGVVRLKASGEVGFDYANASGPYDSHGIEGIAVDSRGRIVTLELQSPRRLREAMHVRITRLGVGGALDPAFGRRGHAWVRQPGDQTRLSAITTDAHDRVLLAGVLASQRTVHNKPFGEPLQRRFMLMRLSSRGRPDRRLGRGRRLTVGFEQPSRTLATSLVVDRLERVVMAGLYLKSGGGGGGVALARLAPTG